MIFRRTHASFLALVAAASALAGERAQTSGARRQEGEKKEEIPTAQTEGERVGLMNRLLRNRQFDVLKSGNSLGGAIEVPMSVPSASSAPMMDPKAQKRILDELERRKNWLVEPGSTTPRELEKTGDPSKDIPDFGRDRNKTRSRRDVENDTAGQGRDLDGRPGSKLAGRDDKSRRRVGDSEERTQDLRDDAGRPDRLEESLTLAARDAVRLDRESKITGTGERSQTWFEFGSSRSGSGREPGAGQEPSFQAGGGLATKEFLNPYVDPSASKGLGDGFSDPSRRLDPTATPSLPFVVRDDAPLGRSESFGTGLGLPSGGASASGFSGGFGAFGPAPASASQSSFLAPISNPEPLSAPKSSGFTPRPAVLTVEPPRVF